MVHYQPIRAFMATAILQLFASVRSVETGNYCGTTWMDAVSRCAKSCPSGAPTECIGDETCFAGTPCTAPVPETPPPVATPLPPQGGTCGNGQVGNAICPIESECCSFYGYCGTSAVHCDNKAIAPQPSPSTGGAAPSIYGTCGGGQIGNGICVDNNECCSQYGYCGVSEEHCVKKVGNFGPDFPASQQTTPQVSVPAAPPMESYPGHTTQQTTPQMSVPAAPPMESYPYPGYTTQQTTPQMTVPAAPPLESYPYPGYTTQQTTPQMTVPAAPPLESYPYPGYTTQQTTPQMTVPAAPPMESYPGYNTQQTTPQMSVPAAPPMESYPYPGYTTQQTTPQMTVPAAPPNYSMTTPQGSIQTAPPMATPMNQQSVPGTCGNGSVGNAICPNVVECCSIHGFCGSTLEYCSNKAIVGSSGSEFTPPAEQQYTPQVPEMQVNNPVTPGMPQGGASSTQTYPQSQLYEPVAPHGTSKTIIGYYAGWQWYDREKLADPENMDFRKLQRVNYAFFQPDAKGNIFGTDRWGDPQLLFGPYSEKLLGGVQKCSYDGPDEVNCAYHEHNKGIINLAHAAGAEVYPSIGGWTLSDHFPTLSADPSARDNFAKKCAEIVEYYGFDGIDIDWEYPGYADHSGTPADKINFTKMLVAIRAALDMLTLTTGKKYGLTAALPCNPQHINNIEVSNLLNTLTEWNLMSYDFFGAWDPVTGVDSPLYPQGFGNDEFCIDRCVKNYMNLGVPKEKLNVGLPFYGRSFKYATALNQTHGGNDVANWPDDDGTPQYFNIHAKLPQMISVRDNKSKTQYAYTSRLEQPGLQLPEGLVSFDDERAICDKVHYNLEHDLGGFIIWELSGDMLDDLRTPLLDITNKKLANPAFECCSLHSQHECELEKLEKQNNNPSSTYEGIDGFNWVEQGYFSESGARAKRWTGHFTFGIIIVSFLLSFG